MRTLVVAGYRLFPAPASTARQCEAAQAHVRFVLLCPTVLPRSGDGVTPQTAPQREVPGGLPADGIGIQATTGPGGPWPGHDLVVPQLFVGAVYGGAADPNDWGLNNPNFLLNFFVLQGQVNPVQLDLAGEIPHQLSLGSRTIAGRKGYLYYMKEHYGNEGGVFARCRYDCEAFVGQLTFVWHVRGTTYAASLQRWSPNPRDPSELAILSALVAHLSSG